ncbi:hypothetical protein Acsp02_11720 [Actinoplanes sp. NBRC 103695]|nr:hypothetical protein Acsp02_11720 [Actinoplanes sp. NBRC 103695]
MYRQSAMRRISAVCAGTLLLLGMTATAAHAAEGTPLGLPGYGAMIVDDEHSLVFVSGGPSSNGIVVTDFDGRVRKTIGKQYGATGMALNADRTKLYVALAAGDAISVIDLNTLREIDRHPTGTRTCPTHLARTGDNIWFGHGCDDNWTGGVGRLDTAVSPATVQTSQQGDARFLRAPVLASADDADGPLVASQLAMSRSTSWAYTVDDNALVSKASSDAPGSNLVDTDVDATGELLYTASRSTNDFPAYETTGLTGRGAYRVGNHPAAVSISPDDQYLALGIQNPGNDVLIYEPGGVLPVNRLDITEDVVALRGLAWSEYATKLFVITVVTSSGPPTLRIIDI